MKYIFTCDATVVGASYYCHYEYEPVNGLDTYLDIRGFIQKNEKEWTQEYVHWHWSTLKKAGIKSHWSWILGSSRMTSWFPSVLKALFFSVALKKITTEKKLDEVYIVDAPKEVFSYIKEFVAEDTVSESRNAFKDLKKNKFKLRPFARKLKIYSKLFVRSLINRAAIEKQTQKQDVLIYSHIINQKSLETTGDHFFGTLINPKNNSFEFGVHWLFSIDQDGFANEMIVKNYLQSIQCNFTVLEDWIRPLDMIKSFLTLFWIRCFVFQLYKTIAPIEVGAEKSNLFARRFLDEFETTGGLTPLFELTLFYGLQAVLQKVQPKLIIYPYEEKGLEKAILLATKKILPSAKTIAFTPALHNPGTLYLQDATQSVPEKPTSDFIGVTGSGARQWLHNHFRVSENRIKVLGSPRHKNRFLISKVKKKNEKLKVLLIVGRGYELVAFAKAVKANLDILQNCELLIRQNLTSWRADQEKGLAILRSSEVSLIENKDGLVEQLQWADVALFCSTSAGIEAMLMGRLTVYVDLNETFDLNPVSGKGDISGLLYCSQVDQLRSTLIQVTKMDEVELEKVINRQIQFAEKIYAEPNFGSEIKKILKISI